jgi:hypothetical protein
MERLFATVSLHYKVAELLDTKFKVGAVFRFRVRKYLFQGASFLGFGESSGNP